MTKLEKLETKFKAKGTKEAAEKELHELSPVEAFQEQVINPATGEIIAERRNWFCPIAQVGTPTFAQEAGPEILREVARPSDLKARVLALTGLSHISELYGGEADLSDEEIMAGLNSDETPESDDFNAAMRNSPYYCDENGVSNFEKAILDAKEIKDEQKRKELQEFVAQSGDPFYQALANLPQDKKQELLAQLQPVVTGDVKDDAQ